MPILSSASDALLRRLQQLGGWQWTMGDSYWYGDYIASRPFPGVRIRIVDFPSRNADGSKYDSDIRLSSPECATPMNVTDEAYRKLLAQIPASHVREIPPFD